MKKVGIITLNGYHNFGNRLQNYALQEILKKNNCSVDTIWINNIRLINQNSNSVRKVRQVLLNPKSLWNKAKYELFAKKDYLKRLQRFKEFSMLYINETKYKIAENELHLNQLSKYDYFVAGSDQVWNPHFMKGSPLYFLTFAEKEKRIAYAPSFGVSEIPSRYEEEYTNWLSNLTHLSVREQAGADIIKRYTNRDVPVIADPTLLLSKEEWLEIAKPAPEKPTVEYLLTYYLGDLPLKTQKFIDEYKNKYNLEVVNLASYKDKKYYLTDPAEFLDYINGAKLFVTDSFHGAVFSILFETPFVVTNRAGSLPSMNSRIDTLLSTYQLEGRHIQNVKGNALEVDFSHVSELLTKERKIAKEYLMKALNK